MMRGSGRSRASGHRGNRNGSKPRGAMRPQRHRINWVPVELTDDPDRRQAIAAHNDPKVRAVLSANTLRAIRGSAQVVDGGRKRVTVLADGCSVTLMASMLRLTDRQRQALQL